MKNRGEKQKTNFQDGDLNLHISIMALNVNRLIFLMKKQVLSEWCFFHNRFFKKQEPNLCCPYEMY